MTSGSLSSDLADPGMIPGSVDRRLRQDHYEKWRRRESNTGPAMSQESVGAIRRAVSGEESGVCVAEADTASALESGGESRRCSNVASRTTYAEFPALVEAAIIALGAGEIGVAKARLQAIAEVVRAQNSRGALAGWCPYHLFRMGPHVHVEPQDWTGRVQFLAHACRPLSIA